MAKVNESYETMVVFSMTDGEDAVNCGLIDELGGLSDALDFLDKMIEER